MGIAIVRDAGTLHTGAAARGDFVCAECGYGVSVHRTLPACPMCRGEEWRAWPSGMPASEPRLSQR